jgi:hypothetical protein
MLVGIDDVSFVILVWFCEAAASNSVAKTVFLLEILELKHGVYFDGSNTLYFQK